MVKSTASTGPASLTTQQRMQQCLNHLLQTFCTLGALHWHSFFEDLTNGSRTHWPAKSMHLCLDQCAISQSVMTWQSSVPFPEPIETLCNQERNQNHFNIVVVSCIIVGDKIVCHNTTWIILECFSQSIDSTNRFFAIETVRLCNASIDPKLAISR